VSGQVEKGDDARKAFQLLADKADHDLHPMIVLEILETNIISNVSN
jgi:hypothetical protein